MKGDLYIFICTQVYNKESIIIYHNSLCTRVLVSMGAVGAIAPMVSESVGASTHGFW